MGDFDTVATMLRRMAARPTVQQQRQARRDGLQPLIGAARAQLAANGSNKTYKLSQALGIASKDAVTSSAGPIRGKKHEGILGVLSMTRDDNGGEGRTRGRAMVSA